MSWVIQFIHKSGGTATITGETLPEVKEKALKASEKYGGAWVVSSVPFIHTRCLWLPAWWKGPCSHCGSVVTIEGMKEIERLATGAQED